MTQYTDIYKRVWGNVDIDNIVVIDGINDTLSIELEDSSEKVLTVPAKTYKLSRSSRKSEIINELSEMFSVEDILKCYLGSVRGDVDYECIVFQTTDGTNIVNVAGSFADSFFL